MLSPETLHSPPAADSDILVRVEGVSKKFCRSLKKSLWYGVHDVASELLPVNRRSKNEIRKSDSLRPEEFWAVRDVSFELRRGECLGLVGRNGAGKTTLLKMLNGLIKPDTGRIEMRGHVGAIIALGAGFNPILTGRENIYIAGSLRGMAKKQIDAKLEEIIDFAELGEFIDSPVQSYSSGMNVRLGFAVAASLEPDVLLLDEVLAVGDAAFRNKCYSRVGDLLGKTAVILVTHNMGHIARICDSALVLKKGEILFHGQASEGISLYDRENKGSEVEAESFESVAHPVTRFRIRIPEKTMQSGDILRLEIEFEAAERLSDAFFIVFAYDEQRTAIAQWFSHRDGARQEIRPGLNRVVFELGPLHFRAGTYRLGIILKDHKGLKPLFWSYLKHRIKFSGDALASAAYQIPTHRVGWE